MGDAKRRRQRRAEFLSENSKCYICKNTATEIEHMPPRILFAHKSAPEDFEFPVCSNCNHKTSSLEQAAVFLLSLKEADLDRVETDRLIKCLNGIKHNNQEIFLEISKKLLISEQKDIFKKYYGSEFGSRLRMAGHGAFELGQECESAIRMLCFKMFYAVYYKEKRNHNFTGRLYSFCLHKVFYRDLIENFIRKFPEATPIKYRGNHRYKNFGYRFWSDTEGKISTFILDLHGQFVLFAMGLSDELPPAEQREKAEQLREAGFHELDFETCIGKA